MTTTTTNGTTAAFDGHDEPHRGTGETGAWVPIKEAAEALSLSVDATRRRLRGELLKGQRRRTPQGHRWYVWLPNDPLTRAAVIGAGEVEDTDAPPLDVPDDLDEVADVAPPAAASRHETRAATSRDQPPPAATTGRAFPEGTPAPTMNGPAPDGNAAEPSERVALQVARAQEMAAYSRALLEPLHARLQELAVDNGRLLERVDHLEAELERARTDAETAKQEAAETVRLAEEAAQLREVTSDAGRPWWRFW